MSYERLARIATVAMMAAIVIPIAAQVQEGVNEAFEKNCDLKYGEGNWTLNETTELPYVARTWECVGNYSSVRGG